MGTYIPLAKTVLTGTQATVEFTSIVGTYTDLVLLVSCRSDNAVAFDTLKLELNDTIANYSFTVVDGYNSSTSSSRGSSQAFGRAGWINGTSSTSSTFTSTEIYFPNYAGSTNKPYSVTTVAENNATTSWDNACFAPLWSNTAAITKIKLYPTSGFFVSGSRFDLYGII